MARDPLDTSAVLLKAAYGEMNGVEVVHRHSAIGIATALQALSNDDVYQMPTTAAALEIVSSDADDTAAGAGAQAVTVVTLDADYAVQTQEVELNGMTAVDLTGTHTRLLGCYVSRSGVYAVAGGGSAQGTITLRVDGGGATWATIGLDGTMSKGRTQVGAYTIPAGKRGLLLGYSLSASAATDFYLMVRESADDVTTPYAALTTLFEHPGATAVSREFAAPSVLLTGPCDIVPVGKTASTANVEFDMTLLVDDVPA